MAGFPACDGLALAALLAEPGLRLDRAACASVMRGGER